MSIHSSLRGVDTLTGERSVLRRIERLQKLQKEGKFDPESEASVYGLPKVRTKFKGASTKKKPEAAAEEAKPEEDAEAEKS